MNASIEILGWLGTFLIVFAYFLVSYKKIQPTSKNYQLLNLFGALGISINVWHHQAWPSFALQIIWGTIALVALYKMARTK
jgi:hypothetical protein